MAIHWNISVQTKAVDQPTNQRTTQLTNLQHHPQNHGDKLLFSFAQ